MGDGRLEVCCLRDFWSGVASNRKQAGREGLAGWFVRVHGWTAGSVGFMGKQENMQVEAEVEPYSVHEGMRSWARGEGAAAYDLGLKWAVHGPLI